MMTPGEMAHLIRISMRIRDVLESWKDVARGDVLCACIVLAATEAGFEGEHTRERFLELFTEIAGLAFDAAKASDAAEARS